VIGDLSYNFVFHDHTLWLYDSLFNHTTLDILAAFLMYPSIVILFLTHWPKKPLSQAVYIIVWSAAATFFEYVGMTLDMFRYEHGWGIWWSFGLLMIAFSLMRLHYKKPLLVWPISAALGIVTALVFKLPFGALK
jgi:hypothetical protein